MVYYLHTCTYLLHIPIGRPCRRDHHQKDNTRKLMLVERARTLRRRNPSPSQACGVHVQQQARDFHTERFSIREDRIHDQSETPRGSTQPSCLQSPVLSKPNDQQTLIILFFSYYIRQGSTNWSCGGQRPEDAVLPSHHQRRQKRQVFTVPGISQRKRTLSSSAHRSYHSTRNVHFPQHRLH